jgi:O-antigen chain-terminating methyltransferase
MAGESADELSVLIREIEERVRARHPSGAGPVGEIPLADLMPLLHARDSAEAKVASIGSVNPRPPGLGNSIAQSVKRLVARALNWHVRDQVEFNRGVMACIQATLEALTAQNRAIHEAVARAVRLEDEARQLRDMRTHWAQWRQEWEAKLSQNEIMFLRNLAESQGAFQHRVTLLEVAYRELVKSQHLDYQSALERTSLHIQKQFHDDLLRVRSESDSIIHRELRTLRQRSVPPVADAAPVSYEAPPTTGIDWLAFAERFRGSEEYVKANQRIYAERFSGCHNVLDLGCGRGELLEILKDAGIPARGIDANAECIALCRQKGLNAEAADLFTSMANSNEAFDGIVCAQVVEHLPPLRLPELVRLASERLSPGGLLAIETPNPECLAILATHFWLDPTHTRPVPAPLLSFWMEEAGLGGIEVVPLNPASDSIPALNSLPDDVHKALFGGMDYAIFGRKTA